MNNTIEKWEKDLKKISASLLAPDGSGSRFSSISSMREYPQLVSFIRSLLSQQRTQTIEEYNGKGLEAYEDGFADGVRQGKKETIEEIKKIIEQNTDKTFGTQDFDGIAGDINAWYLDSLK